VTIPSVMVGGGVAKTTEHLDQYTQTETLAEWGSFTKEEKVGNGGRDYYAHYRGGELQFALNSIGLTNPGIEYAKRNSREMINRYADHGKPLILNISGEGVQDSLELLQKAVEYRFPIVTANAACPNVESGGSRPMPVMCFDIDAMQQFIIRADAKIGSTDNVIMLKVSTGLPLLTLKQICETLKGTSAFSGIITGNTVPGGFHYLEDGQTAIKTRTGIEVGGMSGPAIKPLALSQTKFAADFFGANKEVWHCGGIMNADDCHDAFRAGASAVQLVTGFIEAGQKPEFIRDILVDLAND